MNKPAHPRTASPAYDEDLYGWSGAQAALLRELRPAGFDWESIAEEIEDVGQGQHDALESALRVLLLHLLKWDAQPTHRSRSWLLSIREQRRQIDRRLARNPGLQHHLEALRTEAFRQALVAAQVETGLDANVFPSDPPGWNVIKNPPMTEADLPPR